ncbi:major facilitator superfamily domain-containing protein [Pelagophyceae sp. CCMP2097]|nr:major facilitator superfamily domain-containing protein [Pelagophyceae sp. CCMP2097]
MAPGAMAAVLLTAALAPRHCDAFFATPNSHDRRAGLALPGRSAALRRRRGALRSGAAAPEVPGPEGPGPEALMRLVSGGGGAYAATLALLLSFGVHAVVPFGSLGGVLVDPAVARDLGLTLAEVRLGDSAVFAAWVPGALVGGALADKHGRKPVALAAAALAAAALAALALYHGAEPDAAGGAAGHDAALAALLAARLTVGFGIGGFMNPAYALLVESSSPAGVGRAASGWSAGYVLAVALFAALDAAAPGAAAGLGLDQEPWRLELGAAAAVTLVFTAAAAACVHESPPWLAASGDADAAVAAAARIAAANGVDVDAAALRTALGPATGPAPDPAARADESAAWREVLNAETLLATTAALGLLQLAFNLAYYSLAFAAPALGAGSTSLNVVLLAAADLPGAAAAGLSIDRFGARRTTVAFVGAAGALLLALSFGGAAPGSAAATVLALAGKSAAAGSFIAIFVLSAQLYPAGLVTVGLGCGTVLGKVGAAAVPPLQAALDARAELGLAAAVAFAAVAACQALPAARDGGPAEQGAPRR